MVLIGEPQRRPGAPEANADEREYLECRPNWSRGAQADWAKREGASHRPVRLREGTNDVTIRQGRRGKEKRRRGERRREKRRKKRKKRKKRRREERKKERKRKKEKRGKKKKKKRKKKKKYIRKGGAAGELLWATGGGDLGIWGVRKAYRPAHSVHANLMNRRIDSRQPSGLFGPLVPGGFAAPEVHVVNICQLGESAPLSNGIYFGQHGTCSRNRGKFPGEWGVKGSKI